MWWSVYGYIEYADVDYEHDTGFDTWCVGNFVTEEDANRVREFFTELNRNDRKCVTYSVEKETSQTADEYFAIYNAEVEF